MSRPGRKRGSRRSVLLLFVCTAFILLFASRGRSGPTTHVARMHIQAPDPSDSGLIRGIRREPPPLLLPTEDPDIDRHDGERVDGHGTDPQNAKWPPADSPKSRHKKPIIPARSVARDAKAREADMHINHFDEIRELKRSPDTQRAPYAYTCIVSNEKYIDGALVMGYSIKRHSPLHKAGKANLVMIVNEGIHNKSLQMLLAGGWDYIKVMHSLAYLSPKAYFTNTFDKIYLFGMTQYEKVMFFDADMLAHQSLDSFFDTQLPGPDWVGSVGARGATYFQTGMMYVEPSTKIFEDLFMEYKYGDFNYNQWRARDGILCRNYFQTRHVGLPTLMDLHHYHGYFKPWYNRIKPPPRSEKSADRHYDKWYVRWWDVYEEIHTTILIDLWNQDPSEVYGGLKRPNPSIQPSTHMWLQRYSNFNYTQKLTTAYERDMHFTIEGLKILQGSNCQEVCTEQGMVCHEVALTWSTLNSCEVLKKHFACEHCVPALMNRGAPGALVSGQGSGWFGSGDSKSRLDCITNHLTDEEHKPMCAHAGATKRLCPCISKTDLESNRPVLADL